MQGLKCSQTVYLCLVTGRTFFHLSPPTSNWNNIIYECWVASFMSIVCFMWADIVYILCILHIVNWNTEFIHPWSAKKRRRIKQATFAVMVMCTAKISYLAFIDYHARSAWVSPTVGEKWMKLLFKSINYELLRIILRVASNRHQYFLLVTS